MVTLLAKLFIRDHENVTDPGVRQAYGILCGIVGICFNLILFTTKALAGLFSHSIAITADAFNNLSDAASSIITLVGFRMAGQKPDSDHPFGHGRIEYISGLLVSILIVLMGFELVKSSVSKIFHPEAPDYSPVIIGILVFSIVVKCYMSLYNRRIGTRISSVAMKATAIDSLSDMVATTVVLIYRLRRLRYHYRRLLWCAGRYVHPLLRLCRSKRHDQSPAWAAPRAGTGTADQ